MMGGMTTSLLVDPEDIAYVVGAESHDPLVRDACLRASGRFIAALGYDPTRRVEDFFLTARRFTTLFCPVAPLNEVIYLRDRVTEEDLAYSFVDADSGTIVPADSVREPCSHGTVLAWPTGWKRIALRADVGFEIIPEGIRDAVSEQAIALFSAPDPTIQQLSQGSRSISYSSRGALGVSQRWSDAVAEYKRLVSD